MKSQFIILLSLCSSIAADMDFDDLVKTTSSHFKISNIMDLLGDSGTNIINQQSNIARLSLHIRTTGLKLNKKLKASPFSPHFRKNKTVVVFQATIRRVLEHFGLKFLIKILRGAKVQIKEQRARSRPDPCFVRIVYKLKFINGNWVWILVKEIICP